MNSQRPATPRRPTTVNSRVAEAQALRAAQALTATAAPEMDEPQIDVPSFLRDGASEQIASQKTREELIAEAAYLRAADRGFESGHELDDWLAAEQSVDARLAGES